MKRNHELMQKELEASGYTVKVIERDDNATCIISRPEKNEWDRTPWSIVARYGFNFDSVQVTEEGILEMAFESVYET